MPHWKVFLNGKNFWLLVDGAPRRLGFYTTRFVEAADERAAELAAVQLLRDDPKLKEVLNERSDPPIIVAEEIAEIFAPDQGLSNLGYAFYNEETES